MSPCHVDMMYDKERLKSLAPTSHDANDSDNDDDLIQNTNIHKHDEEEDEEGEQQLMWKFHTHVLVLYVASKSTSKSMHRTSNHSSLLMSTWTLLNDVVAPGIVA